MNDPGLPERILKPTKLHPNQLAVSLFLLSWLVGASSAILLGQALFSYRLTDWRGVTIGIGGGLIALLCWAAAGPIERTGALTLNIIDLEIALQKQHHELQRLKRALGE